MSRFGLGFVQRPLVEALIPAGTGSNIGSPPAAWFDGVNTGATAGVFGTPYGKDYGAGAPKMVSKVRIIGATTRGTTTNTATATVVLESSDDGAAWTQIATSGAIAGAQLAGWIGEATVAAPALHRYYRFTLSNSAGDGNCYLAEAAFYGLT
jgi:hypothetical protein